MPFGILAIRRYFHPEEFQRVVRRIVGDEEDWLYYGLDMNLDPYWSTQDRIAQGTVHISINGTALLRYAPLLSD